MGAENTDLARCPFCGSQEPGIKIARSDDPHEKRDFWCVHCYSCEARGSLKLGLDTACVAWNLAATPAIRDQAFEDAMSAAANATFDTRGSAVEAIRALKGTPTSPFAQALPLGFCDKCNRYLPLHDDRCRGCSAPPSDPERISQTEAIERSAAASLAKDPPSPSPTCDDPNCVYRGKAHPTPYCVPKSPSSDLLKELVDLRELSEAATEGPWELQDGCSWRRIGTRERDGAVLCPSTYSREDRHPDLTCGRGEDLYANLRFIVAAVNFVRAALLKAQQPVERK